jgi:predicted CXXCH cytochrome family protein
MGGLVRPRFPGAGKVNKIFAGIVAALVFSTGVAFAADPPATITFDAKHGKVTFAHKDHQDRLKGDCTKCHATKAGGKIEGFNKDKAHGLCKKCHETEKKGPTKCTECHKK